MKKRIMKKIGPALAALAIFIVFSDVPAQKTPPGLEAKSHVERALVYPDRALITRLSGRLSFKRGRVDVYFRNLPSSLRDESIRVESRGAASARILDVEVKSYSLRASAERKIRDLRAKLAELKDSRERIRNRLRLLKFQRNYLHGVKKHYLERGASTGPGPRAARTSAQYDALLEYLSVRLRKTLDGLFDVGKEHDKIQKRIRYVNQELNRTRRLRGESTRKKMIKATLDVKQSGSGSLAISYVNMRASWKPSYDIRVFAERKQAEFSGYGVVVQNSGEDWINTKLAFSTAHPAVRASVPELKPVYVVVTSAKNSGQIQRREQSRNQRKQSGKKTGSLVFTVPRKTSIPADGSPHRTTLGRDTFPVSFEYLSVPRLSPHTYLRALGRNRTKRPILAGDLNIFMGSDFMGSAYTENILPGEKFELTLNVNENIRVTRELDETSAADAGLLSSRRVFRYSYSIKAENYSGDEITLNIIEQLPLSRSEKLKIAGARFSVAPVLRTKKGIIKWRFRLRPKETKNILYSFNITVPGGKAPAFYTRYKRRKQRRYQRSLRELDELNRNEMLKDAEKRPSAPAMKKFKF